ncbi:MarR family winged helix-turn-helix transcriptional regulator [Pendulispora albinea]|uniref:MarR family transcriptional regulator n=1 Tax=Pendulispora albinea TaxID=2741071 RepID=A0ABZ2LVB2_9BACT
MKRAQKGRNALAESIVKQLGRRHSTATVLFHHAVGEYLKLGPTDHKCLDLLRERPGLTGSELAAITGLTTGAVTGIVARLERAGYLHREDDPDDGRKQILHLVPERVEAVHAIMDPLRGELSALLERFEDHQLAAIAEFLAESTEIAFRQAALLRARSISAGTSPAPSRKGAPT